MKVLDAVKLVVAAMTVVMVVVIMAVARAVIVFKVLFAITLAILGIVVVTGNPGILPSRRVDSSTRMR